MASFVRRNERRDRLFGINRGMRRFRRDFDIEELSDEAVYDRFRFTKHSILALLGNISDELQRPLTDRNQPLSAMLQLLICLRFLATGAFYNVIGDGMSVSKSTVGRCVRRVVPVIASLANRYVQWPQHTINDVKQKFHRLAGFPNVIGAVDGTFIKICAPSANEPDFLNRKGFHSLNVQMTCDASHRITSCVAKWPGSVHDSRIFKDSALCRKFETGTYDGRLLGDSAYACKTYCLTPFVNPTTTTQMNYNRAHCRTRVVIEQTFGILKRRFACLHYELRVSPSTASKIVIACVVLHNFGIYHGDILNELDDTVVPDDNEPDDMQDINDNENGRCMRNAIARHYFS